MKFFQSGMALAAFAAVACAQKKHSYDYIIVGGGTAGSALATRLSQGLPDASILLVEAGPSALDDLRINVPGMRGALLGSNLDWNFTTIAQENLEGRSVPVNRAKVLGGSSAMNFLCYDRASAPEYDAWAQFGNAGWGWDAMIGAMTRGPIRNLYNRVSYPVVDMWTSTSANAGLPVTERKSLGGDNIGMMFQPTNINDDNKTRSYAANSYLPLAGPNLEILTSTQVEKVNLVGCKAGMYKAKGVTLPNGKVINAVREVVVSAGAVQSPGLLELSGVGQPAVLKAAGVTPLIDLPGVGENYQDHIRMSNTYRLKEEVDSFDNLIFDAGGKNATGELQKWLSGERSLYEYTSKAYGFLTWAQLGVADKMKAAAVSVASTSNVVDKKKLEYLGNSRVPSVEYVLDANYVGAFGYKGGKYVTIFTTVMHPMSRGSVHIDPKDPRGKPVIDPKYLNNEYDVLGLVEGGKLARRIAQTEPMASTIQAETEPGPEVESDEQWSTFARKAALTFNHPLGTCPMLPRTDGGVVDADLRVYGTTNLRVVDNSIIPIVPSGHLQTAAYGIAEIAAAKMIAAAKKH
ncbi:hypothetical protein MAPG_00246 [Magnaporthiopsis poae ATCC 64411]|uniref:Glucose-methanol-choline oxidoreductase N-terminal domain-containing protein n=1 Tax=Magnaporthiopsis poae (strain ATCC 64411 / 73-15) TaxID=644358 RepID=A0A0C4DKH3_MAGP6|nr:hypothetical protein MAPG_00246 [Magnaporthiopsis poae ATCC 64411]